MIKRVCFALVVTLLALCNVGGCNLFNEVSDKTSDPAIIDDVNNLIDRSLWFDAISKWYTLSPTGQTNRTYKVVLATAYAGRGGLDLINLINGLNSNASGASPKTLFQYLLSAFQGKTIGSFNDEVQAESIMLGISATASGRTNDENIFLLFVEFAKLGTLFAATGDLDNDGTVDATYDNCLLTATQANHVVTAIGNINDVLTATASNIAQTSLSSLTTACADLVAAGGSCSITDTSSVTGAMRQLGRTLVGETNLGVGLDAPLNRAHCQIPGVVAPINPAADCSLNVGFTFCQ